MRRNRATIRPTIPDPRHQSRVVSKFMSNLMRDGKKSVAESVVYGAFDRIEEVTGRRAIDVFEQALRNVTPIIEWTQRTTQATRFAARKRRTGWPRPTGRSCTTAGRRRRVTALRPRLEATPPPARPPAP